MDLRDQTPGHVHVFQIKEHRGYVKIGKTLCVPQRLTEIAPCMKPLELEQADGKCSGEVSYFG